MSGFNQNDYLFRYIKAEETLIRLYSNNLIINDSLKESSFSSFQRPEISNSTISPMASKRTRQANTVFGVGSSVTHSEATITGSLLPSSRQVVRWLLIYYRVFQKSRPILYS